MVPLVLNILVLCHRVVVSFTSLTANTTRDVGLTTTVIILCHIAALTRCGLLHIPVVESNSAGGRTGMVWIADWVHIGATWQIRLNCRCAAVMWPYVKLL